MMKKLLVIFSVLLLSFGLCSANNKNEWRTYSSKEMEIYVFTTDDWASFEVAEGASAPKFSFKLPPQWRLDGSEIYDKDEKKIGTLDPPGLIRLKNGQSCFGNFKNYLVEASKITGKRPISFNGLVGQVMLSERHYEDGSGGYGTWYPQSFCISNGQFAFTMTFYQLKRSSEVNKDFLKVFQTFSFDK
jgi:hypothetical protein